MKTQGLLLTSLMRQPLTGLLADPPPKKQPAAGLLRGPAWDDVVHSPEIQRALLQELALSRPNPNGDGRHERHGMIFRRDDGSYFVHQLDSAGNTAGSAGGVGLAPIPGLPGATFVADYHTHPNLAGEVIPDATLPKGQVRQATRDPSNGGGSEGDWEYVNARGRSHYVVEYDPKHPTIYRLDHGTLPEQRRGNPNLWTLAQGQ